MAQAFAASPDIERPYLPSLGSITSPEAQARVLAAAPEYMKEVYMGMWSRKMPLSSLNSPIFSQYKKKLDHDWMGAAQHKMEDTFSKFAPPDASWAGWSASANEENIMIRMVDDSIGRVNAAGYYPSELRHAMRETGGIELPSMGAPTIFSENVASLTYHPDYVSNKMVIKRRKKDRYLNSFKDRPDFTSSRFY
jgi:hypothetical protein